MENAWLGLRAPVKHGSCTKQLQSTQRPLELWKSSSTSKAFAQEKKEKVRKFLSSGNRGRLMLACSNRERSGDPCKQQGALHNICRQDFRQVKSQSRKIVWPTATRPRWQFCLFSFLNFATFKAELLHIGFFQSISAFPTKGENFQRPHFWAALSLGNSSSTQSCRFRAVRKNRWTHPTCNTCLLRTFWSCCSIIASCSISFSIKACSCFFLNSFSSSACYLSHTGTKRPNKLQLQITTRKLNVTNELDWYLLPQDLPRRQTESAAIQLNKV